MVLLVLAGVAAVLVFVLFVASAVGASRFRSRYQAERADILHRTSAAPLPEFAAASTAHLPPPLQRYLEATRSCSDSRLKAAVLKQRGTLRTAADRPWMPFEAEQVYSMEPPGFVWLARARLAPLVHMLARDRFVGGRGNMLVSLLGLFTMADGRGPEIDLGAGLRYWGEILAFPEMVRSPYLRWEPLTEREARLTVEQAGLKMTASIEFDDQGLPVGIQANRYRDVGGRSVLTPWSGSMRYWKRLDGRSFPTRWESVWHLPEGDFTAVRIEILDLRTERVAGAVHDPDDAQSREKLGVVTQTEATSGHRGWP